MTAQRGDFDAPDRPAPAADTTDDGRDDIRNERGHYLGKQGTPSEHRTVGDYRAWCHSCGEWCSPSSPCGEPKCCSAHTARVAVPPQGDDELRRRLGAILSADGFSPGGNAGIVGAVLRIIAGRDDLAARERAALATAEAAVARVEDAMDDATPASSPAPRDDSGVREELAAALRANLTEALDGYGWSWAASDLDDIAEELTAELLPVVHEITAQRVAAELRRAAADVRQNHGTASGTAERIYARAAALDPAAHHTEEQQ